MGSLPVSPELQVVVLQKSLPAPARRYGRWSRHTRKITSTNTDTSETVATKKTQTYTERDPATTGLASRTACGRAPATATSATLPPTQLSALRFWLALPA